MNTEIKNENVVALLHAVAVSSGLVKKGLPWCKRVKVAPGSISFNMFGPTEDSNAWQVSFHLSSLRSRKKVDELLHNLAIAAMDFKLYDGYELRFCKADKYVSIIIPDNEKYAA